MFLATSFNESTALLSFLAHRLEPADESQSPPWQEPVLWTFHLDASLPENQRCVHVNYIDRTDNTVRDEDEFLFAPYSVFTVRSVSWEADPIANDYVARPHRIELNVAPDNMREPLELPLAPWC